MHPTALAKRRGEAHNRIIKAMRAIADQRGIAAPDLDNVRNLSPDVQRMMESEAIAAFLEQLAQPAKEEEPKRVALKDEPKRVEAEPKPADSIRHRAERTPTSRKDKASNDKD